MTLAIYADSKHEGQCRTCRALITWAELLSGKQHPFNGRIVNARRRESLFPGGRAIEDVDSRLNASHFSTCPQATQFRNRGRVRNG